MEQDERIFRTITKVKLIKGDVMTEVETNEIEEISQGLGDVTVLSDICGMGWMRCSSCLNKELGCGKRFISGHIRSDPEPVEIVFKDGRVELFDDCQPIP